MKRPAIVFLVMILVLSGCSFPFGEPAEPENITLQVNLVQGMDPVTLELNEVIKNAAEEFERLHPNVTMNIDDTTSFNNFEANTLEMIERGEAPDILLAIPERISILAEKNVFADLKGLAESDDIPPDAFYQSFMEQMSRDGEWLAMPFGADVFAIFYNKEWFDRANLPYPEGDWTWDQYADTALELKKANFMEGVDRFGGFLDFYILGLEAMILSNGGSLIAPDGSQVSGYLDSPETVSAVQFAVDFYRTQGLKEKRIPPLNSFNLSNYFLQGNAGMMVAPATNLFYFDQQLGDRVGIAPLPGFGGQTKANVAYSLGIGIPKQSKHIQTAWDFIKMLTIENNDFSGRITKWIIPAYKELAAAGRMEESVQKVFLSEIEHVQSPATYTNPYFGETIRQFEFNPLLEELFSGEVDVQAQLTLIAKRLDELLENRRIADEETESN